MPTVSDYWNSFLGQMLIIILDVWNWIMENPEKIFMWCFILYLFYKVLVGATRTEIVYLE